MGLCKKGLRLWINRGILPYHYFDCQKRAFDLIPQYILDMQVRILQFYTSVINVALKLTRPGELSPAFKQDIFGSGHLL